VAVLPAPEGPEVAGYLCASVLAGECSLHKIACRRACRRMGIGTRLLHECLRRARLSGAGEVVLEVREHNDAACALYAHNGFTQTGLRKGYYGDTRENARIMLRRLSGPDYAEGLQHA
jgi:[ribosomal protein S18]-alanine N-acetyltransferase